MWKTASVAEAVTSQSRADGSDVTQAVSNSAGFFTGAQNLTVTGGQFLEVHGNYVCHGCSCIIYQ